MISRIPNTKTRSNTQFCEYDLNNGNLKGLDELHSWVDRVHGRFVKQLQANNNEAAVNQLLLLTVFAVEADCADLFVAVMLFVVQVMVEFHETDAAFAVCQHFVCFCVHVTSWAQKILLSGYVCSRETEECQHLLQFCQMKHLDRPKIKILEYMGTIAVKERMLECGIQLLAKAVEVCWVVNDPTTELQLYDRIGYIYYLLGELKSAAFFHDRFLKGKFEPTKSTRKKTAIPFNKSMKFVETGTPKHEITFESLHLFGFTKEYYDCIKTVMADCPHGMKRLYRFNTDPENHLDEHSEHFTKLVEGFGVYFNSFENMDSLKFTLLRCDNLGTAINDYLNEKIPLRKADTEDDLVTSVNNQEGNLLSEDPYGEREQDESTKKLSFLEARIPLDIDRAQLKIKSQYAESTLERSIRVQHKAYLKFV